MKSIIYLSILIATAPLCGQEVVARTPSGELVVVDVKPGESFSETIEMLQLAYGGNQEFLVDFKANSEPSDDVQAKAKAWRDYEAKVTSPEKRDIAYIVNTLGMSSLLKIADNKATIRKAGKRVEHIHPLRFLSTVFTDEEMKASFHALVGRSWVWSDFFGGLRDSFESETNNNNMKQEFISDFAATVGIDIALIATVIANRQWEQLINVLVANIPRNSDAGRYNM